VKYIDSLIVNAQGAGRTPVLTSARTLGRSAALKRKFGGTHVLTHRNLFHQWNAFSARHRMGDLYFLEYMFLVIERSRDDAFMTLLSNFAPAGIEADFRAAVEARYDDVFALFIAWHVYLTLHAARPADVIVDVSRLAKDPDYRASVETGIQTATGTALDLSDADIRVDAPWRPILNAETTRLTVRLLVDSAYAALNATAQERAFGERMMDDAWAEQRAHATYTQAYFDAAAAAPQRLGHDGAQTGFLPQAWPQPWTVVDARIEQTDPSSARQGEIDALEAELAEARQALTDQDAAFAAAEDRRSSLSQSILVEERASMRAAGEAERTRLQVRIDDQAAALAEAYEAMKRLDEELAAARANTEVVAETVRAAHEAQIVQQGGELTLTQTALRDRAEDVAMISLQLNESRIAAAALSEANAALTADLDAARRSIAELEQARATQQGEATEARATIHNALADLAREKDLRMAAAADGAALRDALSAAADQTEARSVKQAAAMADAEQARMRQDEAIAALRLELETVREAAGTAENELRLEIAAARAETAQALEDGAAELAAAQDAHRQALKTAEADADRARVQQGEAEAALRDELQNTLAAAEAANAALTLEMSAAGDEAAKALEKGAAELETARDALREAVENARADAKAFDAERLAARTQTEKDCIKAEKAETESAQALSALQKRLTAAEAHGKKADDELAGLKRSLEYEQVARKGATTQADEAQRALAYLEVAYAAGQEGAEQFETALAEAGADIARAQAEAAEATAQARDVADASARQIEAARGEVAAIGLERDAIRQELDDLRRFHEEVEANRAGVNLHLSSVIEQAEGLTNDLTAQAETIQTLVREGTEREARLAGLQAELADVLHQRNALQAREVELSASLEAADLRHTGLIGERDEAQRQLADRQGELASIKEGVSWRAASTLRRLGVS
jgi:hypothetical protein